MTKAKKEGGLFPIAIAAPALVFVLWVVNLCVCFGWSDENRGTFGDMFGATGSLFSGLALAGIIIAIYLQRQELEFSREELKKSVDAQSRSAAALSEQLKAQEQTTEIMTLNAVVQALDKQIELAIEFCRLFTVSTDADLTMMEEKRAHIVFLTKERDKTLLQLIAHVQVEQTRPADTAPEAVAACDDDIGG